MIAAERETSVLANDDSQWVYIETAQRKYYGKLLKAAEAGRIELVSTKYYDDMPLYLFRVQASKWNPVSGLKRVSNLTEEQRQAMSDRLKRMRNNA